MSYCVFCGIISRETEAEAEESFSFCNRDRKEIDFGLFSKHTAIFTNMCAEKL